MKPQKLKTGRPLSAPASIYGFETAIRKSKTKNQHQPAAFEGRSRPSQYHQPSILNVFWVYVLLAQPSKSRELARCVHPLKSIPNIFSAPLCLADYGVLRVKQVAARASMFPLHCVQSVHHGAVANRAPVNILFGCHLRIFHVKPIAARASMVHSPTLQLAGHCAITKGAPVNIFFGCHLPIFDMKSVAACAPMVNLPSLQRAGHGAIIKRGNCKQILWLPPSHL